MVATIARQHLKTGCRVMGVRIARRRYPGFTLIEVLVATAVIGLLVAIMMPSLRRARELTRSTVCLSNLRQLAIATSGYVACHKDSYPVAQYYADGSDRDVWYAWDFSTIKDNVNRCYLTRPGLIWMGKTIEEVHQCPSFQGGANAVGSWTKRGKPTQRYTGYNYNTSYIGHGQGETPQEAPARAGDVRCPSGCALFGDGEYQDGANKFMRAPWDDPENGGDDFDGRSAGTQGYRHLARTNVVFCDGHAVSWRECYMDTVAGERELLLDAPGTGFLSSDNSMYDLK